MKTAITRILTVVAAAFALAAAGFTAAPAAAQSAYTGYSAARTEGLTRPCFGVLLDYQLKTCHGKVYKPKPRYGYYGSTWNATINCDTARQAYVEETVRRMRPGGVIKLIARNRSCVASLLINNRITIIGESSDPRLPVLVAPDGESCLRINPAADRVVLKNMMIESRRGGQSACIYASNAEVTLQNTTIRYEGDSAALHIAGGRLNLISSFIVAKTRTVAVAVNSAQLFAEQTGITSTSGGLYAVLNGDSQMQGVTVQQLADWRGFERGEGAVGIEIKLDSSDSILNMDDMRVEFFAEAIQLSGAGEALLSRSLIDYSTHGITSALNRVRIIDNKILSEEIAINIDSGTGFIGTNQIARVHTAGILASSRGEIRAVDNQIDASPEACPNLKWGNLDPAQRTCTPWYKGSEFDIPSDATKQYMFSEYWPRLMVASK
ncbi:hypothetical protein [Asticcacaulis sp. YBE204]|uniref:hypothetical protein n=1 Tax=Asticcacaulis sp. YBE204 TaxID=1282363 RepID=UPI0003C3F590|nr:hypothetical protein [Asticcacaulis sp. YBE204]ESQ80205.1 hypothetical protein AEYBE204_06180 [Asticcacaulis sp. YBE204]